MESKPQAPFADSVSFLYTEDLDATAEFYEQVLGLPLALDQGSCRIYQVSATGFFGFCRRAQDGPAAGKGRADVILTLATPDVDAWHARLAAKGVAFEKPPAYHPRFDIYHCFLRDPNGYLLEIQAFCDPAWPGAGRMPRPR